MPLPILSLLETRVLGVLIEKQHTVPDSYPLSLVALTAGCNQKSSRDPVIEVAESEVQAAIDSLRHAMLVIETSGGRVMRYAHNFGRVFGVPPQSVALLAVLMLRGPQTAGELRLNCERLHRFGDISAVEAFLHELADRPAGPLVVELPRQPGAREPRWAHLLCGAPAVPEIKEAVAGVAAGTDVVGLGEVAALRATVAQLTDELAVVKTTVNRLCKELGIEEA
jgi:uncharacterized protein YceH (UPF0502 family)